MSKDDASPDMAPRTLEVNRSWNTERTPRRGPFGWLERCVIRLLEPRLSAQRDFNAAQVRLDDALQRDLEERLAATHRHYDALLGDLGRRLDEADERHRLLEGNLVEQVRDLVERIDAVLLETNRDRHALRHAVDDLRERLRRLETGPGERTP